MFVLGAQNDVVSASPIAHTSHACVCTSCKCAIPLIELPWPQVVDVEAIHELAAACKVTPVILPDMAHDVMLVRVLQLAVLSRRPHASTGGQDH
jgi:hypothetical protein